MTRTAHNKITLTPQQRQFIKDNFYKMTGPQLAKAMGLKTTRVRMFAYEMGMKKMQPEYWTKEQVNFLKENYTTLGDQELSEIFDLKWKKNKGWSKKHIEKKRRYLKLKRTPQQIKAIRARNAAQGRYNTSAKKWKTIGAAPHGTIKVWPRSDKTPTMMIKLNKKYYPYNRWLWKKHHGPIPKGHNIVYKDGNTLNCTIQNLECIPDKELMARNTIGNLPEHIKEISYLKQSITRKINQYKTSQK